MAEWCSSFCTDSLRSCVVMQVVSAAAIQANPAVTASQKSAADPLGDLHKRVPLKFLQAMRVNEEVQKRGGNPEELAKAEKLFEEAFDEASPEVRDQIWDMFNAGGANLPTELKAQFSVLENGRYYITLTNTEGDQKRDRREYPIVVQSDAHPTISMDTPASDIELKQTESVPVVWRARDDFAVSEVALVVESSGNADSNMRFVLAGPKQKAKAREGRYTYRPGEEALGSEDGDRP